MALGLRIPGLVCLGIAFVLSFLVSVSLPSLPEIDITRTHYGTVASGAAGANEISELRVRASFSVYLSVFVSEGYFVSAVWHLVCMF
jgi:hypothetical protein